MGEFFLAFEQKLIRNGYSQTEAMFAVTSMQVELGVVKIEQLGKAVAAQLQRYTYPVMPMDIRSILKSLGVIHDSQVAGELIDMIGHADYFIADKAMTHERSGIKLKVTI